MSRLFFRSSLSLLITGLQMWCQTAFAQDSTVATTAEKRSQGPATRAVIFTTQQDHENMLQQLGRTWHRRGVITGWAATT